MVIISISLDLWTTAQANCICHNAAMCPDENSFLILRETKKSYVLVVTAQDGGHGRDPAERQIGFCQIEIKITDVNDNYPMFLIRKYFGSVKENAPTDMSILHVSASDPDEGVNAVILYSIKVCHESSPLDSVLLETASV